MKSLVLLLFLLPLTAVAQEVRLLPCAQVAFFGEPCVDAPPPPAPLPPPPAPLLMRLLDAPSPEKARAYLAWQRERMARITEVQKLLRETMQEKHP
jgi:hypothetical protein